jgi:hypothetical protein
MNVFQLRPKQRARHGGVVRRMGRARSTPDHIGTDMTTAAAGRRMGRTGLAIAAGVVLALGAAPPALAQKCDDAGRLRYLGRFADDSATIWLSRSLLSQSRNYRLEAAQQGGQGGGFSSDFAIPARGLHLSLSPVVSQGGGGVHQLYLLPENCFVDSQNQQGGVVPGAAMGAP